MSASFMSVSVQSYQSSTDDVLCPTGSNSRPGVTVSLNDDSNRRTRTEHALENPDGVDSGRALYRRVLRAPLRAF